MSHRVHGPFCLGLIALVAAACGASGSTGPSPTPPSSTIPPIPSASLAPSVSPTVAPSKGPASARLALTGTAGLTGPVTAQTITCGRPSLTGPQIFFVGQSGTSGPQIVIFARSGDVEVRVANGSAATLVERDFTGTGVSNFDAASGAMFDSALTETTAPGSAIGTLGALSRISGSIDCGSQLPGSANVVLTGSTPFGQMSGALTGVEVECTGTGQGLYVGVVGLGMAGATPVLVFATASAGMIQVSIETASAAAVYIGNGTGLTTLVRSGASMAGDLGEKVAAPATPSPSLLHVMGTATCGTP
jgi:hypothetical protein